MTAFEQKFIENPLFLKWIFHSNTSIDQYWDKYLQEHPEERVQIFDLKALLGGLKYSTEALEYFEKEDIANWINLRIDRDLQKNKRKLLVASFMKYAAVAVVFALIGGLLVYLRTGGSSVFDRFADQIVQIPSVSQSTVLIRSNGENIDLRKSSSTVDYSSRGSVVLNNDSVIQAEAENSNAMNQLIVPYGSQTEVILPDHTHVWLNAGSRLVYPTQFQGKTREVMLFGEAFFKVTKNADHAFVVNTSDLEVTVLGTEFNLSAYAEDNVIQTVLKEGSVSVQRRNSGFYEKALTLKPNQMALFNKNSKEINVYQVDADNYTFWIQGLLSFDEIDFNRIIKKVERFYNIRISFSDPKLGMMRISGKLDLKQNKEEVLEYLGKVSLTNIKRVNNSQYIVNK